MSPPPPDPRGWNAAFGAWVLSCVAMAGSLFFSEVMDLVPCSLCWAQRIFMFPLPFVLGAGLLPFDPRGYRYGLVLCGVGGAFAVWHNLLYAGLLPESAAPCAQGVSCSAPTFALFGLFSIPLLSLGAFGAIAAMLLLQRRMVRT